jgi:hypothetical protein
MVDDLRVRARVVRARVLLGRACLTPYHVYYHHVM